MQITDEHLKRIFEAGHNHAQFLTATPYGLIAAMESELHKIMEEEGG